MSREQVPLEDEKRFARLTRVVWGWDVCHCSRDGQSCTENSCTEQQYTKFGRYWQFCKAVMKPIQDGSSAAEGLDDDEKILQVISTIKSNPEITKAQLEQSLLESYHIAIVPSHSPSIIHSAVRIMTTANCVGTHVSLQRLGRADARIHWGQDVPFSTFIEHAFPVTRHPILSDVTNADYMEYKDDLRVTKLKKNLGVTIRGTSDLQDHLKLDRRSNILEVFHHGAFLKEQLRLTKFTAKELSTSESLKLGALPRQLALETLDSLESILFPVAQRKPRDVLKRLVSNEDWDPDLMSPEFSATRNEGEENVAYYYLADRLSELHNELENPRPRGWFERLIERKTGGRYVMMATLAGVLVAVLLGVATLVVSCLQTWIAYQAWRYPISLST